MTSIDNKAFYDCSSLKSITIGNGVTRISDYAFYGCSLLSNINYQGTKAEWIAISKDSYWNGNATFTITCTDGKLDKNGNELIEN